MTQKAITRNSLSAWSGPQILETGCFIADNVKILVRNATKVAKKISRAKFLFGE